MSIGITSIALILSITSGFRQLLQSQWGSIIKPNHETVFQDMKRPLSHYFINSSHNTYITGTQLAGEATVEGYIKALNKGVRLLECNFPLSAISKRYNRRTVEGSTLLFKESHLLAVSCGYLAF